MSTAALPSQAGIRCYYRPILLAIGLMIIMGVFWFVSRYPQLLHKSTQLGNEMSSMANTGDLIKVAADAPWYAKIGWGAINWLDTMKKGMTFGVLSGALLHTILKYYPLKIGQNLYLNSLKGALVGVPAGVCANCSVPMACGVTRGDGRVEVALGFLFSSPNFNPIVVMMTFSALPLSMFVTKYVLLLFVIAVFVPAAVGWLEKSGPLKLLPVDEHGGACEIPSSASPCEQSFLATLSELSTEFAKNVWMLLKPTIAIMLCMSVLAATLLSFLPWDQWLSANPTPLMLLGIAFLAVLMPVPIALDVLFAALLLKHGRSPAYVMVFTIGLGAYSLVPSIYLWREVSRKLSVILLLFFTLASWGLGLLYL